VNAFKQLVPIAPNTPIGPSIALCLFGMQLCSTVMLRLPKAADKGYDQVCCAATGFLHKWCVALSHLGLARLLKDPS